jgi:hypothetical protein
LLIGEFHTLADTHNSFLEDRILHNIRIISKMRAEFRKIAKQHFIKDLSNSNKGDAFLLEHDADLVKILHDGVSF